jgi:hypothetical protein
MCYLSGIPWNSNCLLDSGEGVFDPGLQRNLSGYAVCVWFHDAFEVTHFIGFCQRIRIGCGGRFTIFCPCSGCGKEHQKKKVVCVEFIHSHEKLKN